MGEAWAEMSERLLFNLLGDRWVLLTASVIERVLAAAAAMCDCWLYSDD